MRYRHRANVAIKKADQTAEKTSRYTKLGEKK